MLFPKISIPSHKNKISTATTRAEQFSVSALFSHPVQLLRYIDLLTVKKISSLNEERSVGLRLNLADLTLDLIYVILLYSSSVELIEVLTGCSYINIEYCDVSIRPVILDEHSVLSCVHAAYLGTVRLTLLLAVTS